MRGGVAKSRRTRRCSPKLQERLLDAVTSEGAKLPSNHGEQSLANGDLAQETTLLPYDTRQPDAASVIHSLPAKRTRSTRTDTQGPGTGDEKAVKTARQPPKPNSPKPRVESSEQVSPASRLRKRQIDSDSEHRLKRARLSRENLALFDKMVKKGSNQAPTHPDSMGKSTITTTKTTSTTTSGFAVRARDNGILDHRSSKPPMNLEDIQKQYARSRETASPPESRYQSYVNRVEGAENEATMTYEVSRHLLKEYDDDKGYKKSFNRAFIAFPKDVGFNNGLSTPQPDLIEGLEAEEFRPFPISNHIPSAVLYKDNPHSITLPHLAGEWKGRDGNMTEAALQCGYDGAALVYARNSALSLIRKPDPPGHAEVRTFATDGTTIKFFAHYAAQSEEDNAIKYHQYQYASANLTDTYQGHKDSRRGFRNQQDYARDLSYALRDQLREDWKERSRDFQPIAEGAPPPNANGTFEKTNGDEAEADYEVVELPGQPTPATSSHPRRTSVSVPWSKPLLPANDCVSDSSGQKRRASSSQGSAHKSSRQRSKEQNDKERDATEAEDDDRD